MLNTPPLLLSTDDSSLVYSCACHAATRRQLAADLMLTDLFFMFSVLDLGYTPNQGKVSFLSHPAIMTKCLNDWVRTMNDWKVVFVSYTNTCQRKDQKMRTYVLLKSCKNHCRYYLFCKLWFEILVIESNPEVPSQRTIESPHQKDILWNLPACVRCITKNQQVNSDLSILVTSVFIWSNNWQC